MNSDKVKKTVPAEDCTDLIDALERQYKLVQRIAFYFIPREVMEDVIVCSKDIENLIKKYKSN